MRNKGNRRSWAIGALVLAVLAVDLDGTVLGVALPTLAAALHASESGLQWFSSGYLSVLAAAMLQAGLLGDRYGRKKVMLTALILFGIGSWLPPMYRRQARSSRRAWRSGRWAAHNRDRAFGADGVVHRGGAAAGGRHLGCCRLPGAAARPDLGGSLLTGYWWGWVCLMNMPVALVGLVATFALVPESRAPERPGFDPVAVVASTSGLVVVACG